VTLIVATPDFAIRRQLGSGIVLHAASICNAAPVAEAGTGKFDDVRENYKNVTSLARDFAVS
jgi:hypothetical protein